MIVLIFIIFVVLYLIIISLFEHLQRRNDLEHKRNLVNYIKPFVHENDSILDIGSGSGSIAMLMNAQPIDVVDLHEVGLPPVIFDGKQIPYADKSFDVSMCISVLHHTDTQYEILKEMKRVSNTIIIFEDIPDTPLDHVLCSLHSLSSYGKCRKCFHTTQEWEKIFYNNGLNLQYTVEIPRAYSPFYPVKRKLFVLQC